MQLTRVLVASPLMSLSENVKKRRAEKRMSQAVLAERAGLSQQLISQIERGVNRSMTADNLAALAKALECPVTDLSPSLEGMFSGDAALIGQRILSLSEKRRIRMLETLLDLEAADTTDREEKEKPTEHQG